MTTLEIRQHNTAVLNSLEKGDLVECDRGLYSHWAVYTGEERVIHLTGDENTVNESVANSNSGSLFTICGIQFNKAFVKVDNFWKVANGCKVYKNNSKDERMSPAKAEEIVQRGLAKIGEIGYHVLWSNCEHFASYCRYGESESDQVKTLFLWGTICAFVGVITFGVWSFNSEKKKK